MEDNVFSHYPPFNITSEQFIPIGQTSNNWIINTPSARYIAESRDIPPEHQDEHRTVLTLEGEHKVLCDLRLLGATVPESYGLLELEGRGRVLVKEFIEGSTLESFLYSEGSLQEREALSIISNLLNFMGKLKQLGYYHLDLVDANIILRPTTNGREAVVVDVKELSDNPIDERRMLMNFRHGPLSAVLSKLSDNNNAIKVLEEMNDKIMSSEEISIIDLQRILMEEGS